MRKLKVDLGDRSYNILIGEGLLGRISERLNALNLNSSKLVLISNRKVYGLYGKKLVEDLKSNGFEVLRYLIPDGEKAKSFSEANKAYSFFAKKKVNRSHTILALGGGVVGDFAGFIGATFLRGIPFIQIPTTLLAQVDSSVGGKVAINLEEGKNLVGSFYQPLAVLIDPLTLKTLDDRQWKCGMAEVIKYGFIWDAAFFRYLRKNSSLILKKKLEVLEKMIYWSVKIKALVVGEDEQEKGIRAILNFGHTFGHSIEKTWNYKRYNHGEGVAMGMLMALYCSFEQGAISKKEFEKSLPIFKDFNLQSELPKKEGIRDLIFKNLFFDKKMTDQGLTFILIEKIGKVFIKKGMDSKIIQTFIRNYPNIESKEC